MNIDNRINLIWRLWIILIPTLCFGEELSRGANRVGPPIPNKYRKSWAIIIGINYTGRQDEMAKDPANKRALPELKNAANDAKALAELLKEYYQYDAENVTILTDDSDTKNIPTASRIREKINLLCDPKQVNEEDSVLFFFAGHGMRLEDSLNSHENSVTLLPYDVDLSKGRPTGLNKIDISAELISYLEQIPAKHKLVILDCCYSGEIFNTTGRYSFQPRTVATTEDRDLQVYPTFQAMVSCRATQETPDKSKFIKSLMDGLRYIPARSDDDRRVWSHRLLSYMSPDFSKVPQKPDCRNLIGTVGEFCFFPRDPAKFAKFTLAEEEKTHLKSMVVSRQGNWWFDEIPWFIPTVRTAILKQHEKLQVTNRSAEFSELINLAELRNSAESLLQTMRINPDSNSVDRVLSDVLKEQKHAYSEAKDDAHRDAARSMIENLLNHTRMKHFRILIEANDADKRKLALLEIESDFASFSSLDSHMLGSQTIESTQENEFSLKAMLTPSDLHLLALAKHAMGKTEEAELAYLHAIEGYDHYRIEDPNQTKASLHIPAALCRADYAEFLEKVSRRPIAAATQFAAARENILKLLKRDSDRSEDSAAFFRIFMLCREADAWLSVNRWSMANDCLSRAQELAEALAPNHYLQAHVFRRKGWGEIIQWRFSSSIAAFESSNRILDEYFRHDAELRNEVLTSQIDNDVESVHQLSKHFHDSKDQYSKIAYLHNLHGIGMAKRFQGDTVAAASYYRWLYSEVERAYSKFRNTTNRTLIAYPESSEADVEKQFFTRRINTQERLGDCNLFGDPKVRDLSEAVDDYRRSLSLVHMLRGDERDRTRATLLYKQALALSLASPVKNIVLAKEICQSADLIFEDLKKKNEPIGLWQALGQLASKAVNCIYEGANNADRDEPRGGSATHELRVAIEAYRDVIGSTPHRDQLEFCLFASKVLLEQGNQKNGYEIAADANLLLSFCRMALMPFTGENNGINEFESLNYLRPYYDSVMRAKIRNSSTYVKDLLEIQWEATNGSIYIKNKENYPKLAIYILDEQCYMLLDIPGKESKCLSLLELYDISDIKKACYTNRLPLPRGVQDSLDEWFRDNQNVNRNSWESLYCWWTDPVQLPTKDREVQFTSLTVNPVSKSVQAKGQFPFFISSQNPDGPP